MSSVQEEYIISQIHSILSGKLRENFKYTITRTSINDPYIKIFFYYKKVILTYREIYVGTHSDRLDMMNMLDMIILDVIFVFKSEYQIKFLNNKKFIKPEELEDFYIDENFIIAQHIEKIYPESFFTINIKIYHIKPTVLYNIIISKSTRGVLLKRVFEELPKKLNTYYTQRISELIFQSIQYYIKYNIEQELDRYLIDADFNYNKIYLKTLFEPYEEPLNSLLKLEIHQKLPAIKQAAIDLGLI